MAASENTVLVEIVTAANLGGIEQAKASLLGFNASTLGLAAGLGLLYAGTKSAIDITLARSGAEADLQNAIKDRNAVDAQVNDPKAVANVQKAQTELAKAQQALGLEEDRLAAKRKLTKADLDELKIKNDAVTKAEQQLTQAVQAVSQSHQGQRYDSAVLQQQVRDFIDTNRDFVSSQTDVVQGYASFVREGVPAKDLTTAMNAALDISISEHIPLSQAVELLQSAEAGRATGLRKLVGIQLENVSATATEAEKAKIASDNLKLVAAAYDKARDNLSPFERKVNDLNNDWQKMANDYGPAAITALDGIAGALDGVYQKMVSIGNDNDFWAKLQTLITHNLLLPAPQDVIDAGIGAAGGGYRPVRSGRQRVVAPDPLSGEPTQQDVKIFVNNTDPNDPHRLARTIATVLRQASQV